MKKWMLLSVLVIVGGGALGVPLLRHGDGRPEVTWVTVESRPITMTVETNGTVEPLSTIQVGCEVTGKIIDLPADHDQPVRKGQVICRIDPELATAEHEQSLADHLKATSALADARLALQELVANLPVQTQQALARKQEAEANLVDAEYTWKRVDALYKKENASETEWNAGKAQWLRAQASLTAAEAAHRLARNDEKTKVDRAREAVAQAEAALKLAEARRDFTATRVGRCTVTSPIDGIVLRRYFDVGTTVTAAFQTPILFLLAPSLQRMRVHAKVSESDISHVEVGQKARFTLEARQSHTFEGRILQKRNQPDILQNVVTYTVIFEVDNPDGILIPGLSVNVVVECVDKKAVPVVANAALRFKPPLPVDQRQTLLEAAPVPPAPATDAEGSPAAYRSEAVAWQFDEATRAWRAVRLWVGITDNVNTEVLAGAGAGERLVRKYEEKQSSTFSLKEALKLARPDNRSL